MKTQKEMIIPEIGNYGIHSLSIRVVNEMEDENIIDPTEVVDDYNPSIYFDGKNWNIDDYEFTTEGKLEDYLYQGIENKITDIYPDDDETYMVVDELDIDLINYETGLILELNKKNMEVI